MTGVEVLEARPDRSGGYKVDVGRGQRIGRVSSEWFSPDGVPGVAERHERVGRLKARGEPGPERYEPHG